MSIYNSKQWISDIEDVVQSLPELLELAGKTVMVTGAAGLICSAVVDVFFRYNESHDVPINILAAGRWPEEMEKRFCEYCVKPYYRFISYNAVKGENDLNIPCDYVIHGASNASPDMIGKEPVETMCSNFTGLLELLQYAKECGAKRLLYISSSEVYGKKEGNTPFHTDEYGYIDLLNPRNSYSMGKRAAETLCASFSAEYGVETVIVRPGHIYGPTASPYDTRVSSVWAYAAARGDDIVMKSDGAQLRSYCYCLDCAAAILKVLLCGKNLHAYNISNPASIISIREMAEILAESAEVELKLEFPTEEEKKIFNPMRNSALDSRELAALGWSGLFNAECGFSHTIEILKEIINQDKLRGDRM